MSKGARSRDHVRWILFHLAFTDSRLNFYPLFLQQTMDNKRSPSDFLKSVLGRPVRVKLNSGLEYRGVLACLDGYLNIAMEQTEEYNVDGQLKAKYGDCFIRGNNGASFCCCCAAFRVAAVEGSVAINRLTSDF